MGERLKVLILGAGNGGTKLMETFGDEPEIEVAGVADRNPGAMGMGLAKERGYPVFSSVDEALDNTRPDIVFNVTGDERLTGRIMERVGKDTVCIGGNGAKIFWSMLETKKKSLEDLRRLYEIEVQLSSFTSTENLFAFFLEKAKELTDSDAASIAVYDEKLNELRMVAAEGFSDEFMMGSLKWGTRVRGLTAMILNSEEPVVIEDADSHPLFTNPLLKKEGVKALMASIIRSENKILGISYVDSFRPRKFTPREITAFRLLSTQAATAIEKTKIIENFHKMAYEDELTGLRNYRFFLEAGMAELARSKRHGHKLSVVLIDMDNFKKYNDDFGHQAGNYLLAKLGSIMKTSFRNTDIPARYGGEEFVVILTEAGKEVALKRAEWFRSYLSEELSAEKDPGIFRNVTVSMGVSGYPEDGEDLHVLVRRADEALYRAKEKGRNRVEAAS